MRALVLIPAVILASLALPAPAFAELTDDDREAILDLVERFRQAVVATDEDRVLDLLGPSFNEARRVELAGKIRGFKGYNIQFSLSPNPAMIQEDPSGQVSLSTSQSFRAQRAGSNINVNGMGADFEFEKVAGENGAVWRISKTDVDKYWSFGAIAKLVGSIFGIIGLGCCVLVLVPVGIIIVVTKRKKQAPDKGDAQPA